MCGISGVIGNNICQADIDRVICMNEMQRHRGPDDEGIYHSDNIVLGHRRLSILDLSSAGHQPMEYMGKYVISYNGEVYNYLELREELSREGYKFESNTDTEVVMASYDKWGVNCFEKFNGFWAIALYEIENKQLILSRDRFGVKPLHYSIIDNQLLFSSEIKALLSDIRINRVANENVILDFLVNGVVDFSNETFFKGINRIPAGSYMIVKDNIEKIEIVKFFDIQFSDEINTKITNEHIVEFRRKFENSIKLRLRSDVPVGSCLSGGLDSSSIVCHVNKELSENKLCVLQETFSACYHDFKLDERRYIESVVEFTGVKPNYIYPSLDEFNNDFDHLIYTQEEPFGSTSIYASYCVMREARKRKIPVLLDGQGADELLCGYRKSRIYYVKKLIKNRKYIRAVRETILSVSQFKTSQFRKSELAKIKLILFRNSKNNNSRRYIAPSYNIDLQYNYNNSDNFLYNDVSKISLPSLLRYADRNSMAFSVEDRLPFLDYQFANYVASLPLSVKLYKGYSKYIMRKALIMPEKIKKRKDKIGFATPERQWLTKNSDKFYKLFNSNDFRAKKYINKDLIVKNWSKIIDGTENIVLFRYICLEKWMQIFDVK